MRSETYLLVISCLFVVLISSAGSVKDTKRDKRDAAGVVDGSTANGGSAPAPESTKTNKTNNKVPSKDKMNCTNVNDTNCSGHGIVNKIMGYIDNNKGMLMRTMYVLIGVTGVVVFYFVVRTVRLRRRRSKTKKYGVLTTANDLEMAPLDQDDDDDEDMTVFEVNGRPR